MDGITSAEREVAKEVADNAMIVGWDKAIQRKAQNLGTNELSIRQVLNKAAEYNDKADPSGRIHELEDWSVEKRERSERASGPNARIDALRKLKPSTPQSGGSHHGSGG